jgi:gliding motility-associated-like protein
MDQVNVTVNPLPAVNAGPDQVVCEGTSVTLSGSGAMGYSWNNGVIDGVPFTPAVGALTYTLTGTGANGCQNTDQVEVTVNPNPVVEAGENQSVCDGTPIKLAAIGTPNLYWNNGVVNNVNFMQPVGIVTYIVTDSLSTGCTSTDSLTVEVLPNPIVTAEDAVLCEGEGVTLNGSGAISYVWTGGVIDGVEFFPTSDGSYTVTGTAANGCTAQATANIVVHPAPNVYFKILNISLTTTSSTTGFDNLTTGAVSYSWDFGDGSANSTEFQPVHTFPAESGEYEITLTAYSEYGCPGMYRKYVHVFLDYTIYVPNTFTPDNSGTNDVFKPVMEGFDPNEYTLYIFNRWGNLVFESHDMDHGWDGTINQRVEQVMDGVYTWKIVAGLKESADTKMFVGHVSLLK